jgi:hypothetical protein
MTETRKTTELAKPLLPLKPETLKNVKILLEALKPYVQGEDPK